VFGQIILLLVTDLIIIEDSSQHSHNGLRLYYSGKTEELMQF